jgi:hypothetical protein
MVSASVEEKTGGSEEVESEEMVLAVRLLPIEKRSRNHR